jgi:hypothetical protein
VPKLDCTKITGEADPCDRPQKIRSELFLSTTLHHYNGHKEARSSSRPYVDCKVVQINEKEQVGRSLRSAESFYIIFVVYLQCQLNG